MYKLLQVLPIFLIVYACNNSQTDYSQSNGETITFNTPKKLLLPPIQTFEIRQTSDTVIIGEMGTKIIIPSNCFETTDEEIKIELEEFYDFPSMFKRGLTTKSDQEILETDGMIRIHATTLSGEPVIIKPDKFVTIEMPSCNTDMGLFYGSVEQEIINWKPDVIIADTLDNIGFVDSVSFSLDARYNIFEITKFGWINADKFLEYDNKTDLFVSLPKNQTGAVYSLAFYTYNSILPGVPNDNGVLEFKGVPANQKVTLIAIGSKDEKLYYSALDLTTDSKNAKLSPLQEISKDQLQTELEKKFGKSLANRHQPSF